MEIEHNSILDLENKQVNPNFEYNDLNNFVRSGETKKLHFAEDKEGGFLIPENFVDKMLKAIGDISPFRKFANNIKINHNSFRYLVEHSHPEVNWADEKEERKESENQQLNYLKIELHNLYARLLASQVFLQDVNIDPNEWIINSIKQQFIRAENFAFIQGDGVKCPKGIMKYERTNNLASKFTMKVDDENVYKLKTIDAKKADKIDPKDLFKARDVFPSSFLKDAAWFLSRKSLEKLRLIGDNLWQKSIVRNHPDLLLGLPLYFIDEMPSVDEGGSALMLANLRSGYQIVDHSDVIILRDPYTKKPYIEFYIEKRVGGGIINFDSFVLLDFS